MNFLLMLILVISTSDVKFQNNDLTLKHLIFYNSETKNINSHYVHIKYNDYEIKTKDTNQIGKYLAAYIELQKIIDYQPSNQEYDVYCYLDKIYLGKHVIKDKTTYYLTENDNKIIFGSKSDFDLFFAELQKIYFIIKEFKK